MPLRMLRYYTDIRMSWSGEPLRQYLIYIDMLEILSENRELQEIIKKVEKMLTQVGIQKLPSYQLGMEQGLEKGLEEGLE